MTNEEVARKVTEDITAAILKKAKNEEKFLNIFVGLAQEAHQRNLF